MSVLPTYRLYCTGTLVPWLCLMLLFPFMAEAQFRHEVYDDLEGGYSIGIFGRYQLASNAVSASMMNALYSGKDLSREMRETTSGRLGASNRIGVDGDFGLFFRHLPDSTKGVGYFIRIADRYHAHATPSGDLVDVAMLGNRQFAGRTADMGGLRGDFYNYKQYEVGILKSWQRSATQWDIGVGISLLTGNRSVRFDIADATLFTHPDGEYLDLEIHGTVQTSSLASTQYFAANGMGFSVSAHLGMKADRVSWLVQVDDLGLVSWGRRLRHHDIDTVAQFNGFSIDLLGGDPLAAVNLDTITSQLITSRDGDQYTTMLAGSVRAEGSYRLGEKDWRVYVGVHHRFAPGYFPLIYVGTGATLPKQFYIDGRFAYGGFGSWNVGLELRKKFGEHVAVRLGSFNLEGYLLPGVATGQSAYIGLTGYF